MVKIMKKESIFTPTFVINTLISFLFYIVFYVLTSSIGTYALQQLHQSTVVSLSLSSVFVIGALIGRVWTGINITRSKGGEEKAIISVSNLKTPADVKQVKDKILVTFKLLSCLCGSELGARRISAIS